MFKVTSPRQSQDQALVSDGLKHLLSVKDSTKQNWLRCRERGGGRGGREREEGREETSLGGLRSQSDAAGKEGPLLTLLDPLRDNSMAIPLPGSTARGLAWRKSAGASMHTTAGKGVTLATSRTSCKGITSWSRSCEREFFSKQRKLQRGSGCPQAHGL